MIQTTPRPYPIRMMLCVLTMITPAVWAQSANEILDASKAALAEVAGFQAQFRMSGEGGSMFTETMPSMNGKVIFGQTETFGRVIRTVGEGKDKQKDPSKPLDQLITSDRYIWVDFQKKTITEAPNSPNARGLPSSLSLVLLDSIILDDPYAKDANNAESITLGAEEEVAGVMCDQIMIKRQKPEGNARRGAQSYTDVIRWIGKDDKLPRKVHQITDAGMVKITLAFELSNLQIGAPNPDQLDVRRPDDFRFISKMPKPREESTTDVEISDEPETIDRPTPPSPSVRNEPRTPTNPLAPIYAFTTVEGQNIDNTTQQGRVTALYFTGSWCVPCVETGPLVDSIRSEIENDEFDLFALSIREGDPKRAELAFKASYPKIPLSVNPTSTGSDFKVRVYPTIVVIDAQGEIVFQKSIGKGYTSEQLTQDARAEINKALNSL